VFVILLKFSAGKANAPTFMAAHNAWLQQGFDDGVFLLSGSLVPGVGGAVMAHNTSRADLDKRVSSDPFVEHDVVIPEIHEIRAGKLDERLGFLIT
jgi:uncharacterized protein YciI